MSIYSLYKKNRKYIKINFFEVVKDFTVPGNYLALNFLFYSPFSFSCRHLLPHRTKCSSNTKESVAVWEEASGLQFCLNFFLRLYTAS